MSSPAPEEMAARGPLLPRVERAGAGAEQRAVIDELLAARGKPDGRLANLYAMMAHQPEVARRMGAIGAYCRFHAKPDELTRETAILAACHRTGFGYEVRAHEEIARDRGLPESEIEALRRGDHDGLGGERALAARFAAAALDGTVTDGLAQAVLEHFGADGLLDLTAMTAHYRALAIYDHVLRPDPDPAGASLSRPAEARR